jgi:intein/homing endonuclease
MLTGTEIMYEYTECLIDPVYAICTYLKTFDKTQEGFVPFKLFPKQIQIVESYKKYRFTMITKPRQAGVSTTSAAYAATKAVFADPNNPEAILIIANKQEMAFEFLDKIKDFVSQYPRWVWGDEYYGTDEKEGKSIYLVESKKELKLPNGSRIKAVATSKDALRGFTPTWLIMDEAAFIDDGAIVFGAALTALGCLKKDSLILTEDGLITMDELVKEKDEVGFTDLIKPHRVCNKDGDITEATKTFVSDYGETFRIKTKLGIELEGSWKHPILINNNGNEQWVKMSDLNVGDKPIIQYNQNYFGKSGFFNPNFKKSGNNKDVTIPINLEDNLDFTYLLGLFVAEGNFCSRGINITNVDPHIQSFLLNDTAKLGGAFKQVDNRHFQFHSTELVNWFDQFGLKKRNAKDKEIPLSLLKMPKNVIKSFLQGMFDGDGMSTIKDIKYSSTSKKLIDTLQVLLLNFGIISHVKKEIQKTSKSSIVSNKNHICEIYNLKIYSNYAIKFYNEIGFRLNRKQDNCTFLKNKINNSRYVNISKETLNKVLKDNNTPKYKVKFLDRFWTSKYERLTYHSLYKLLDLFPNDDDLCNLLKQVNHNESFYVDEILSITTSEDYTYDLHVPKTNSFISNGIVSHNTGGRATLISTPNGMDALYHKTYEQSKKGKNDFHIIEMKWYQDPRYTTNQQTKVRDLIWIHEEDDNDVIEELKYLNYGDSEESVLEIYTHYENMVNKGYKPSSSWYREMCRGMNNDKKMIAQELDVSFIGSGGNVIDDKYIIIQERLNVCEPLYTAGDKDEIWIWEEPIEGHEYILIADVARGDGGDNSTIVVIDFTTMTQVMEYEGQLQPDLLGTLVDEYARIYDSLVVVDVTGGWGVGTITQCQYLGTPNLYYDETSAKPLERVTNKTPKEGNIGKYPGFNCTAGRRAPIIRNLEKMIRLNAVKVRSKRMVSEMRTFVFKNGRADHMDGYHDDLLMPLAYGLWVMETSFKKLKEAKAKTKAMLAGWIRNDGRVVNDNDDLKRNGFISKNDRKKKVTSKKPNFNSQVSKNMQDPKGNYMWLFSGSK